MSQLSKPIDRVAVKNGTLGTVLAVEAQGERLTVRLDGPEGKNAPVVTFYIRNYGHVDHGYAATVHKAQGVTVDRAHVLASRFMDRHAAYVALTRHRDGVSLHYGRDEFRDGAALARALSRERLKDTSLDYNGPEAAARKGEALARRYAGRRGLDPLRPESAIVVLPEPEASAAAELEAEPARAPRPGRFSGLRLGVGRVAPAPVRMTAAEPEEDALSRAVGRFARAWEDAARMERAGLPVLPHQQRALEDAAGVVDDEQPGFAREVALTLREKPALGAAAAGSVAGRAALIARAELDEVWRAEGVRREAERRAALEPVWSRLTEEHLEAWRRKEMASPATWGRRGLAPEWVEQARAELRRGVEALPEAELKRAVARWQEADAQRQREAQRQAERPRSGPSLGR